MSLEALTRVPQAFVLEVFLFVGVLPSLQIDKSCLWSVPPATWWTRAASTAGILDLVIRLLNFPQCMSGEN